MNTTDGKQDRAVVNARSATPGDGNGSGTDAQVQACREFAEKCGLDVADIFSNEGSAVLQLDRPQLTALCELIAQDATIRSVVIADLNRLSRSLGHLMGLYTELMKAGVAIRVVQKEQPHWTRSLDLASLGSSCHPRLPTLTRAPAKKKARAAEDIS